MCLDREIDFQDVFKVSELVWDAVSAPDDRDRRRVLTHTARTEDIRPRDSTDQSHDLDSEDFEMHPFRSGVNRETVFVWPYLHRRFEAVRLMLEELHHMRFGLVGDCHKGKNRESGVGVEGGGRERDRDASRSEGEDAGGGGGGNGGGCASRVRAGGGDEHGRMVGDGGGGVRRRRVPFRGSHIQ
jgi:hypothetical protein